MFDRSSGRLLIQEVVACGTEDVLTCHVIIMREPATGVSLIVNNKQYNGKPNSAGLLNAVGVFGLGKDNRV